MANERDLVESCLAMAREDIGAARHSLGKYPRQAAYAIERGAEKLVTAVLAAEGIRPPPSHQIGALVALLPDDHPWRNDLIGFDALIGYATTVRTPTPRGKIPPLPPLAVLERQLAEVEGLAGEIGDWCLERMSSPTRRME